MRSDLVPAVQESVGHKPVQRGMQEKIEAPSDDDEEGLDFFEDGPKSVKKEERSSGSGRPSGGSAAAACEGDKASPEKGGSGQAAPRVLGKGRKHKQVDEEKVGLTADGARGGGKARGGTGMKFLKQTAAICIGLVITGFFFAILWLALQVANRPSPAPAAPAAAAPSPGSPTSAAHAEAPGTASSASTPLPAEVPQVTVPPVAPVWILPPTEAFVQPAAEQKAEAAEPLPEGWQVYLDQKTGQPYYYNTAEKKSQWTRPGSEVAQAIRLAKTVDTSCILQVFTQPQVGPKPARGKGWHAQSKEWHLEAPGSRLSFSSSAVRSPEKELDMWLENHTLLCRVVSGKSALGARTSGNTAIVSLANTLGYLLSYEKHELRLWDGLVARLEYAESHGLPSYLWLGSFSAEDARWRPGDKKPERVCENPEEGFHVMKAIAALALFDRHQDLSSLVYMDADTIPANMTITTADYLSIAPSADFIGTSNHHLPILMNGGFWILKNTPWGRRLMQQWWANRCGRADQGALWHSLFELWAADVPSFHYDPAMFSTYEKARALALPAIVDQQALRPAGSPELACTGRCGEIYSRSGCLTRPLLLPHVLILPVVPMVIRGRLVVPLQHHLGSAQWVCHFDTSTTPDQCYMEGPRVFAVPSEEELPSNDAMSKCRDGRVTRYGFTCDCNRLLSSGRARPKHR